ncbi:MAG TPA: S8 family serine peptidase, partial [Candidatus Glassbacteria bacterium]|nr:S8 family serine peptidase [Candidatus Glassbacteria bacterium]
GDPATVSDVPDILNMSFADNSNRGCLTVYWSAIDNLKLLGTVPVFASGNYKDHGTKVGSPGNGPAYFAVTSVDSLNQLVSHSMPGPSLCDPKVIKPDLVAPGQAVLTLRGYDNVLPDQYSYSNGSSFAAPLVSGVAALIHQANPELLPDQVYTALRNSATDLGVAGPDTLFGWGAVNADSAVALAGRPTRWNFSITKIDYQAGSDGQISPGEEVAVVLNVYNIGTAASSVSATLSSNSADVTVKSASASFGNLAAGASAANSSSPFVLAFDQRTPLNSVRTFKVRFAGGSFTQDLSFALTVGNVQTPAVESYATHDINRAWLTVTNFGMLGKEGNSGGGFVYPRVSSSSPDH